MCYNVVAIFHHDIKATKCAWSRRKEKDGYLLISRTGCLIFTASSMSKRYCHDDIWPCRIAEMKVFLVMLNDFSFRVFSFKLKQACNTAWHFVKWFETFCPKISHQKFFFIYLKNCWKNNWGRNFLWMPSTSMWFFTIHKRFQFSNAGRDENLSDQFYIQTNFLIYL